MVVVAEDLERCCSHLLVLLQCRHRERVSHSHEPLLVFLHRGWVEQQHEGSEVQHDPGEAVEGLALFLRDNYLLSLFPSDSDQHCLEKKEEDILALDLLLLCCCGTGGIDLQHHHQHHRRRHLEIHTYAAVDLLNL